VSEFSNVWAHPQTGVDANGNPTYDFTKPLIATRESPSAKLGRITDTAGFYNPRQFQFALKLLF